MTDKGLKTTDLSRIRPATGARWVVEAQGVRLFTSGGEGIFLSYPGAAIWDFVVKGYEQRRIFELLRAIANLEEQVARRVCVECIEQLLRSGYLERSVDE